MNFIEVSKLRSNSKESKGQATFLVLDCKDNLKNDPESQPYIFECNEENLKNLPLVTFFVSPSIRMNLKTQKLNRRTLSSSNAQV